MEIDDFPAGWHLPNATWFATYTPVPKTFDAFTRQVVSESGGGIRYAPLFTTQQKAANYIIGSLLRADVSAFKDVVFLLLTLGSLESHGITHIAFDVEDPNEPELRPIADAIESLRQFLP